VVLRLVAEVFWLFRPMPAATTSPMAGLLRVVEVVEADVADVDNAVLEAELELVRVVVLDNVDDDERLEVEFA